MEEPLILYKLIILYMLNRVSFSLTNTQISDFILEKEYTSYFTLQQTIHELLDSGLIQSKQIRNSSFYALTEEGKKTLDFFSNRISPAIQDDIQAYFKANQLKLRDEKSNLADYYKNTVHEFTVECRVREKDTDLIRIAITVPEEEQAQNMCLKWEEKSQDIYSYIMKELLES